MTGTVTLSVELELGWGMDSDGKLEARLSPDRSNEDACLERLLALCDDVGIPITFNVVGHLFLESCDGAHDAPHPIGPRGEDPGTDAESDPLFYAPEMLRKITGADVDHELARHTFSHIDCDVHDPDALDWEFERSNREYERAGLSRPESLVPPWHRETPRDVEREHGVLTKRVPFDDVSPTEPRILWFMGRRRHPIRDPALVDGVVETYSTSYPSLTTPLFPNGQDDPHWHYRVVPAPIRRRIHRRFLRETVDNTVVADSHVHHWTHLWNMANEDQMDLIASFLRTLRDRRDRGDVAVLTMAELGERTRANL